jgi:hypothetical protein
VRTPHLVLLQQLPEQLQAHVEGHTLRRRPEQRQQAARAQPRYACALRCRAHGCSIMMPSHGAAVWPHAGAAAAAGGRSGSISLVRKPCADQQRLHDRRCQAQHAPVLLLWQLRQQPRHHVAEGLRPQVGLAERLASVTVVVASQRCRCALVQQRLRARHRQRPAAPVAGHMPRAPRPAAAQTLAAACEARTSPCLNVTGSMPAARSCCAVWARACCWPGCCCCCCVRAPSGKKVWKTSELSVDAMALLAPRLKGVWRWCRSASSSTSSS